MERDPQVEALLKGLTQDQSDPLLPVWSHIADEYSDGGCCRSLKMLIASLTAAQDGAAARAMPEKRTCPYPGFEGAPMKPEHFLRMAWMSGYERADNSRRLAVAEGKLYDAYKLIDEAHTTGENGFTEYREIAKHGYTAAKFAELTAASQAKVKKALDNIRIAWATMLTPSLKERIRREEREADEREAALHGWGP